MNPPYAEMSTAEIRARLEKTERELDGLREALALLGAKACCRCGMFFRTSDPKALLRAKEPVCYGCIAAWWQEHGLQFSGEERRRLEHKLVTWLVREHAAKLVTKPEKHSEAACLVVNCWECQAAQTAAPRCCRHCTDGRNWVLLSDNNTEAVKASA